LRKAWNLSEAIRSVKSTRPRMLAAAAASSVELLLELTGTLLEDAMFLRSGFLGEVVLAFSSL